MRSNRSCGAWDINGSLDVFGADNDECASGEAPVMQRVDHLADRFIDKLNSIFEAGVWCRKGIGVAVACEFFAQR